MKRMYVTPDCPVCGESSFVAVKEDALKAWQNGMYVQDAFPDFDADKRELLMTGTHPECWDSMFAE